jgi:hypothetical protein
MHEYEQVLRDRTTTGREAGRAKPGQGIRKLDTEKRVKQVGCTREYTEQAKT